MSECLKCGVESGSHFVGEGNMPVCPPIMNKPIAWINPDPEYEQICPEVGFEATICCEQHPRDLGWIPLYAQPAWLGLTDDEISEVLGSDIHDEYSGELRFIRLIEQALKDKNT